MLYFKTKKGRLVIQISIDIDQFIYMLICPPKDERVFGNYDYVNEKVWENLRKVSEPLILEQNQADYESYNQAVENENDWQQEMADMDWMMSKAYHL